MAYKAVLDFGGATFDDGSNSVTFDEAIGAITYKKKFSSESYNERTGQKYLGDFLGWQVTIKIVGIYNLEDGDAEKINTLQTILENNSCSIKPRDSDTPNIATIEYSDMQLISDFEVQDLYLTNVGQKVKDLIFERLLTVSQMSQLNELTGIAFYVDENGDYYVDEVGNTYISTEE